MQKFITIELFKVSPDGQFLELIADCPKGYQFYSFMLTAHYKMNGQEIENCFDIGDKLFKEMVGIRTNDEGKEEFVYKYSNHTHWVIRIPIKEQLNIEVPAIYTATFKARQVSRDKGPSILDWVKNDVDGVEIVEEDYKRESWKGDSFEEDEIIDSYMNSRTYQPQELEPAVAICSDVSNIYKLLMDELINQKEGDCSGISDTAIRNYLIMYAHQEALRLGHLTDAFLYFDMINNNFSKCGTFNRSCNNSGGQSSCGCSSRIQVKKSGGSSSSSSSCGCGKK